MRTRARLKCLMLLLSALSVGVLTLLNDPTRAQDGGVEDTHWQTFADIAGLSAAYNHVTAIGQTRDGALWFGTGEVGIVRYNGQAWRTYTSADGLARGGVSSIWQDRTGRLWVATRGGGVSYLPPAAETWHTYTMANTEGGLTSDRVLAILEDQDGTLWFGTDEGVSRLTLYGQDGGEQWQTYTVADGLASNHVTAIIQDHDGALWFGTADAGVSRYAEDEWTAFTTAGGLASNRITTIWIDRDGDLWFGTHKGVSHLGLHGPDNEEQWRTLTTENTQSGLACDEITAILQDRQGSLWFGTIDPATGGGCGLSRYAIGVRGEEMWQHFTEQDGLASDAVSAMLEDSDGALWFGTHNPYRGTASGVSRYDDRAWRAFVPQEGLANNWVTTILRDRNGDLWLGHDEGTVSRLLESRGPEVGPASQIYTTRDGLSPRYVTSILEEDDGTLWVGTQRGLGVFDGRAWHSTLEDGRVTSLVPNPQGGVWVGASTGLWHLDGEAERTVGSVKRVTALAVDAQERLWVGTRGYGVSLYTPHLEGWQTYTITNGLASNEVSSIVVDTAGQVWLGHWEGQASQYDGDTDTWTSHTICEGAGGGWRTLLLKDRMGRLWAGCWSTRQPVGSAPYRYEAGQWRLLPTDETVGMPDDIPLVPLYADDDGAVWFGTISSGAVRYDGESWSTCTTIGLSDNRVRAAYVDHQGGMWLGTYGGGVTYFPPGADLGTGHDGVTYTTADDLASNYVVSILEDQRGTLWFGTGNPDTCEEGRGVTRYDGQNWQTFTTADGLSTNYVGAIFEDQQGYIWFGTGCPTGWYSDEEDSDPWGGVTRYDPNVSPDQAWRTYTATLGLEGHYVRAIGQDQAGALLFATDEGISRYFEVDGVERWEPFTTTLQAVTAILADRAGMLWFGGAEGGVAHHRPDREPYTFGAEDGLADGEVTSVLQDRSGTVWVGSQAGVSRYDGERWRVFNTENSGLGDDRVNAIVETDRGEIVFGTDLWYSIYAPGLPPPQVTVDQFDGKAYVDAADLMLPYHRTAIQAHLLITDMHTTADALGLCLQLEGPGGRCDAEDISPDREAFVECTGLEPGGSYTLSVAAGNANLDYGEPDTILFAVKPEPLWVQWWFWPTVAGVLVSVGVPVGVWGYVWWRTRPRKYTDYLLAVSSVQAGQVQVTMEAQGQPTGTRTLELEHEEINRLVLQVAKGQCGKGLLEYLGRQLCDTLFVSDQLVTLERPARLRLDFSGAPELMAWPWELAFDVAGLGFLGQRADTALVRFVPMTTPEEKPLVSQRLKVLVVMAQPADERVAKLGLAEEKERLDEILSGMKQVELGYLLGVHAGALVGGEAAARDLADQLAERLAEGWDVVHFVGHAGPDLLGSSDEIVLWSEDRRGDYMALGPEELVVMLGGLTSEGKAPKLMVLNACRTADVGSGLVQAILGSGVRAVVGMQWPVLDVAARAFAAGFYGTLVQHGQVDYAVSAARNRMAGEVGLDRRDWAGPALVTQTPDGIIFERV